MYLIILCIYLSFVRTHQVLENKLQYETKSQSIPEYEKNYFVSFVYAESSTIFQNKASFRDLKNFNYYLIYLGDIFSQMALYYG